MKMTLGFNDFYNEVKKYSDDYKNQFSDEALETLFNYVCDIEEDTGEEIEFDFILLCCEYSEVEKEDYYNNDYEVSQNEGYIISELGNDNILYACH